MASNSDVELEIAQSINALLRQLEIMPPGYQCDVHLHRGNRKKRRDADFEGNWDADTDSVRIAFSPMEEEADIAVFPKVGSNGVKAESHEDRLKDLVHALDVAEGRPGYQFVSLKWFRDTALAHEAFPWASDESARRDVLGDAIARRWILTSKVANPRPPNFPVTAIRLNRSMPEVNAALGGRNSSLPGFRPVTIRGEGLSATILHDRR